MEKKSRPFGKSVLLALISSVGLTAIGSLINLISYFTTKNLLLYRRLTGGEWTGQEGFGLLLNHTWPFQWDGQVVTKGRIWIEFSPKSLIYALILCFLIAFVIIFPFRVKKEKFNMQCCIGLVLSLPLPIVLVFIVYNLLFTVFYFPSVAEYAMVVIALVSMVAGLVISIKGVVSSKKGISKGRWYGFAGIIQSTIGIIGVVALVVRLISGNIR